MHDARVGKRDLFRILPDDTLVCPAYGAIANCNLSSSLSNLLGRRVRRTIGEQGSLESLSDFHG